MQILCYRCMDEGCKWDQKNYRVKSLYYIQGPFVILYLKLKNYKHTITFFYLFFFSWFHHIHQLYLLFLSFLFLLVTLLFPHSPHQNGIDICHDSLRTKPFTRYFTGWQKSFINYLSNIISTQKYMDVLLINQKNPCAKAKFHL